MIKHSIHGNFTLLGFKRSSKETYSLQIFGGWNWEDLFVATSSISIKLQMRTQMQSMTAFN